MMHGHDRLKVIRLVPVLDFGGVEMITAIQSELLDPQAFELRVCTFWKEGQTARAIRAMGVPVDVLDINPAVRNPLATYTLWLYLMRHRPDVLHATAAEAMYHGAIAGALAGVPLRIIEDVGIPSRRKLGNMIFGALGHTVHHAIGCSAATCQFLMERDGMPRSRVSVVYNCGKPEFFAPRARAPRDLSQPLRVLTVGRLVSVKNHLMLIDVMRDLVHTDGRRVHLDIAGEGEMRAELERAIQRADLEGHVQLLGFREDILELLYDHDLFVIPSKTEGSSIALIEAMATGIPVLTSTAEGLIEVIGALSSSHALAAQDQQAWRTRIGDMAQWSASRLDEYAALGRKHVHASFSPQHHIRQLEALYRGGRR